MSLLVVKRKPIFVPNEKVIRKLDTDKVRNVQNNVDCYRNSCVWYNYNNVLKCNFKGNIISTK